MAPTSRTHRWETVLAGAWKDLGDASLQDALEAAFASGSDGYQFKARGYTYDVDFSRMKQVNLTTKRERNLRRVPDPHSASVTPASATHATVHVPSTVLYHGPTAGRLYTGPSTVAASKTSSLSGPTKATRAGSVWLHPGPAPTPAAAPTPAVAPKTSKTVAPAAAPTPAVVPKKSKTVAAPTAAPTLAVAPKMAAPLKTSTTAAPVATAWTAKASVMSAPAATAPVPVAPPPPAPKPTLPAKKPLPHQGRVKMFNKEKGFGFIVLDDNEEVFFHISCVSEFIDDSIRANDTVEVSVAKGAKPRALQVRVKRRGSIFKQMCKNKCCVDKGDRHFEDRCPLKRKRCDRDDASVSTACS